MSLKKFITLRQLIEKADALRKQSKSIVLCHGTFDLFHAGHMRHLQRAKREGDILCVTITGDEYVNKGPGRPVFGETIRAETIAALECVDFVAINHAEASTEVISSIKPSVYVKGNDYSDPETDITGNIDAERSAIENVGGRIFYTDEVTFSSSNLLNQYFEVFSPDTKNYLSKISSKYGADNIIKSLKDLSKQKVLVFGDAIIDQYHYVDMLGHVGKGNALAVRFGSKEQFSGGSIAVANHVAAISNHTTLLTAVGQADDNEDFILSSLMDNVTSKLLLLEDMRTVTKRRFVDHDLNKLFEVYFDNAENFRTI